MNTPLQQFRKEYTRLSISEPGLSADPFEQFKFWFADATEAAHPEPNAMALATASPGGMPSIRMVLLKDILKDGFVFFTNYKSRKAKHLDKNPNAALLFFWEKLERQIRIEGMVEKTDPAYSDAYFQSRTPESRAGAIASEQSSVIDSREILEKKYRKILTSGSQNLERPNDWGAYKLKPVLFEFWQGREHRLHDRIQYRQENGGWIKERLAP